MGTIADPFGWTRRPAREVRVGDVGIGGNNPIRVQSMTTTQTGDIVATAAQAARLARAGCEIVRVTVPTTRDAAALPGIRAALRREGIRVPLVADVHFSPPVAMLAVEHVEKVRINPGNFADRKRFEVFEITDAEYGAELDRIGEAFRPLVLRAKELGVAMRIGANHGSLSDRIMNRYGDTPLGMVESALEFVRICESHGYRDIVLSMKSSSPRVAIHAYRRLIARMAEEGMDYPVHLGVTEAGEGEDGRIKSAVGIGTLLEEGIGDTVRVSLTEDPVEEIPVAFRLVEKFNRRIISGTATSGPIVLTTPVSERRNPFCPTRRSSREAVFGPLAIGGGRRVGVEVSLGPLPADTDEVEALRAVVDHSAGGSLPEVERGDVLEFFVRSAPNLLPAARLRRLIEETAPQAAFSLSLVAPVLRSGREVLSSLVACAHRVTVLLPPPDASTGIEGGLRALAEEAAAARCGLLLAGAGTRATSPEPAVEQLLRAVALAHGSGLESVAAAIDPSFSAAPVGAVRLLAARLDAAGLDVPIVLLDDAPRRGEDFLLGSSSFAGSLLCDGIGDSLRIAAPSPSESRRAALGILQAARVRISRADFVSCPSCGRTQFELESTSRRIRERTGHLKGVRIAIMGCVVNGPGEMADADFGYVGWGKGRIALFVGSEMVARDIPASQAEDRLVELIKDRGRWTDPP